MTNIEIIENERLLYNIDEDLEIDTYQGWKNKGYSINKGEKALFKTKIWKPRKEINRLEKDSEENVDPEKKEKYNSKFILVNSAFFSERQVRKVGE